MSAHVAVIGGGWAGLACAVELARADIQVSVFESAPLLGGRARVVEKDGWRVDNGQHLLIGGYTETLRMLRLLKVSPKRLWSSPFFVHSRTAGPARCALARAFSPGGRTFPRHGSHLG